MKEILKKSFRPNLINICAAFLLLAWQYFYNFQGIRVESFGFLGQYFSIGLRIVDWNNYFVRSFFMVILWLLVAFLIFATIWLVEYTSIRSHNKKVEKGLINNEATNVIKKQQFKIDFHVKGVLYLSGSLLSFVAGFFLFSGILEKIRYVVTDVIVLNFIENNVAIDYASSYIQIVGFVAMFPVWYLYASLVAFLYFASREKMDTAKISDEHFAVVVDEDSLEETENI
jgi:hypothetical protein